MCAIKVISQLFQVFCLEKNSLRIKGFFFVERDLNGNSIYKLKIKKKKKKKNKKERFVQYLVSACMGI